MFFETNTQIAAGAANRVRASLRLGRMLAALIAVGVASAALAASPAMADTQSVDSRATATQKCVPPTYDDPKAEIDQASLQAAIEPFAICVSTPHPSDAPADDPKGEDAIGAKSYPLYVFCEVGTSPNYIGACAWHQGPEWHSCILEFNHTLTCSHWNDGGVWPTRP